MTTRIFFSEVLNPFYLDKVDIVSISNFPHGTLPLCMSVSTLQRLVYLPSDKNIKTLRFSYFPDIKESQVLIHFILPLGTEVQAPNGA